MAPHPRILPWFSWDEWHQVMRGLFAPQHRQKDRKRDVEEEWAQQVWALEVVGLWRLRSRVPHSVDSTAQLVEVR